MIGACVRAAPLGTDAHSNYGSIGVGVRVIVSDGMGMGRSHSPEEKDVGGLTRRVVGHSSRIFRSGCAQLLPVGD